MKVLKIFGKAYRGNATHPKFGIRQVASVKFGIATFYDGTKVPVKELKDFVRIED